MAAFPDAKVILTVRDPASWYESAYLFHFMLTPYHIDNRRYNTIYQRKKQHESLEQIFGESEPLFHDMCDIIQWEGVFKGKFLK